MCSHGSSPRARPLQQPDEEQRCEQGKEEEDGVPSGVLGEPNVLVGHRQQERGHHAFASTHHGRAQAIQHGDSSDAEHKSGQPDRPRVLPQSCDREVGQQGVERVIVISGKRCDDLREWLPDRLYQRDNLVKPQAGIETGDTQQRCKDG